MHKFKIGYVIKYFHPIKGGAEKNILNLALRAVNDGHEVHVFTSDRKGKEVISKREENFKGIKIHRSRTWFDFSLYLGFYPSLLKNLLKADLDIIHVSGFGFIWHDFVLILKKIFSKNTKFINTPHGPFMTLRSYNILLKIVRTAYTLVQKLFLNWLYDAVIQVNTFQWRWIVKYGIAKAKIKFVAIGIPAEEINRKFSYSVKSNFVRKYELEDKFVISYLGRISEYKGVQHVIDILPKLRDNFPNIAFLVMGRDEGYVRTLKSIAEKAGVRNNIRFVVNISENEKFVALELSQIFVFPSEWEAFGIVMLEAMARGNALVSTKTEGGKFLVTEGVNGYLYEFGDSEELYQLLSQIMKDRGLMIEMQKKNRQRVKEFSWEQIGSKQYLPLLSSVIGGSI